MLSKAGRYLVPTLRTAFVLALLSGCAHNYQSGVISLQDIDCASCGFMMVEELREAPNVKDATFDKQNAEVHFQYNANQTSPNDIVKNLEWTQYKIEAGAGKGSYTTMRSFEKSIDVKQITKPGQMVDIQKHLVPGKITVIDFFATWCGPCRSADEFFGGLLQHRTDIALRKLDIIDWDSDLAKHYLQGVTEIPYMIVYDAQGNEMARLSGFKKEELKKLLKVENH